MQNWFPRVWHGGREQSNKTPKLIQAIEMHKRFSHVNRHNRNKKKAHFDFHF